MNSLLLTKATYEFQSAPFSMNSLLLTKAAYKFQSTPFSLNLLLLTKAAYKSFAAYKFCCCLQIVLLLTNFLYAYLLLTNLEKLHMPLNFFNI